MILVDNNILSTFARVGELELIFGLFRQSKLGVTPAVLAEMDQALAQGCPWLEEAKRLLASGRLELAAPRAEEVLAADSLPASLGPGERESIAICQTRLWTFLTNDRRARNYCRQAGLRVYGLGRVVEGALERRDTFAAVRAGALCPDGSRRGHGHSEQGGDFPKVTRGGRTHGPSTINHPP